MSMPVLEPAKFSNVLVTSYNLTTNSINITCRATGIPKPSITWTQVESKEIISTKEYYEVPFKKYDKTKLIFYCHASNVLGKVRSSEIQVHGKGHRYRGFTKSLYSIYIFLHFEHSGNNVEYLATPATAMFLRQKRLESKNKYLESF